MSKLIPISQLNKIIDNKINFYFALANDDDINSVLAIESIYNIRIKFNLSFSKY